MADSRPVRIGEMLTRAGVLREQDLDEACNIAEETGQMIGKVLIMSEYISKNDLQAAVEAQSLVRDGQLELELALVALSAACRNKMTLEQSLDQLGWSAPDNGFSARLGELLLAAQLLRPEQLTMALEEVRESIVPLGAVLVKRGAISAEILRETLNIQSDIRAGKISRSEGIGRVSRLKTA